MSISRPLGVLSVQRLAGIVAAIVTVTMPFLDTQPPFLGGFIQGLGRLINTTAQRIKHGCLDSSGTYVPNLSCAGATSYLGIYSCIIGELPSQCSAHHTHRPSIIDADVRRHEVNKPLSPIHDWGMSVRCSEPSLAARNEPAQAAHSKGWAEAGDYRRHKGVAQFVATYCHTSDAVLAVEALRLFSWT